MFVAKEARVMSVTKQYNTLERSASGSSVQREPNKIRVQFNLHVMVRIAESAGLFVVAFPSYPERPSCYTRPPSSLDLLASLITSDMLMPGGRAGEARAP